MGKRWRFQPHDEARIAFLEKAAEVPPVVAQLLVGRSITDPAEAKSFLDIKLSGLRDPERLPGLPEAADRIHEAVQAKKRIIVYGDYDADGMTGASILIRCLKALNADVGSYVPNRMDEGYGLNDDALQRLANQGAKVVISVDCGIASVGPAETAKNLGLELIITDHHEFADRLPDAAAIVHPRLPGTNYPFHGLCGAGVAFKLAWGLCQRASQSRKVNERLRNVLLSAVGLAAIGTVADVVPLVDENRVLVHQGLNCLKEYPLLGIEHLMKVTQLDKKPKLGSDDIGFMLAPRLNASGRLGQATLGVELLTTESQHRAEALAEYIHQLNDSRDSLERSIYLAANKQIKDNYDVETEPALVLAQAGWHPGVIGIVAGRLAEKYHRPVIMIAFDSLGVKPGTGSARSAGGLNLHEALQACTHHLLAHGGHAAAAGLKIEESKLDAFRTEFCEYAAETIPMENRTAEILIHAEVPLTQLTLRTVKQIDSLAPFGAGNPRPVLSASNVEIAGQPKKIGAGERHVSLKIKQQNLTLRAVAFGQADWVDEWAQHEGPIDIAFHPVLNTYNGRISVELQLVDWRQAQSATAQQNHDTPARQSTAQP